MRRNLLVAPVGLALSAGGTLGSVTDYQAGAPTLYASWQIGGPGLRFLPPSSSPDPGTPIYSMDDSAVTGGSFLNGGAAIQSGNTITRMVADDAQTIGYQAGAMVTRMYFTVANTNAVSVSARIRLRFWSDNGSGMPGSSFPTGAPLGLSFQVISFAPNSANLFFVNVPFGSVPMPLPGVQTQLWLGMTFDNNSGSTGATIAQMNRLGQLTVSPSPTVGVSSNQVFQTTAAGSFFAMDNPAGSPVFLSPGTNLGWELVADNVPGPGAGAVLGAGLLVAARRRRARSS